MGVLTSDAIILRTWPVQEADLIVSFFTRDYGKVRGVAKAALKSRKRFGGALEPMTVARAWFAERPGQELARLDQLEIQSSPLMQPVDAARMTALSLYAEVLDEALPDHDPQETVFRLLVAVLEQTVAEQPGAGERKAAGVWMPVTYFLLWMTRLIGLLPDLGHCTVCGEPLHGAEFFYSSYGDGLLCPVHRGGNSNVLSEEGWRLAQRMLKQPVAAFAGEPWPQRRGQDLRHFAVQALERHLEKGLKSAEAMARLG